MKIMHENGNYALGILDCDNYVVFDKRTRRESKTEVNGVEKTHISYKYAYYTRMEHAIKELSRRVADHTASDLREWVSVIKKTHVELVALCAPDTTHVS